MLARVSTIFAEVTIMEIRLVLVSLIILLLVSQGAGQSSQKFGDPNSRRTCAVSVAINSTSVKA